MVLLLTRASRGIRSTSSRNLRARRCARSTVRVWEQACWKWSARRRSRSRSRQRCVTQDPNREYVLSHRGYCVRYHQRSCDCFAATKRGPETLHVAVNSQCAGRTGRVEDPGGGPPKLSSDAPATCPANHHGTWDNFTSPAPAFTFCITSTTRVTRTSTAASMC